MNYLDTNVFEITNLDMLKAQYKLYRIKGLTSELDEYERNLQILIKKLSYKLLSPVTVIKRNGNSYLALRNDAPQLPDKYELIRATAVFEQTDETIELDFNNLSEETLTICQRFMQFAINGNLNNHHAIWQPSAGQAFYYRSPNHSDSGIDIYRGAAIRVIVLENNKLALCIDIKHKYVSQYPLNAKISSDTFKSLKYSNSVYHWGSKWYDIKLYSLSELKAGEYPIKQEDGSSISLNEYIRQKAPKPLPKEVIDLDPESSVLIYKTGSDQLRGAPSCLCYQDFDTNSPKVSRLHNYTVLPPHIRRKEIEQFVKTIKGSLRLGNTAIKVSETSLKIPRKQFLVPDLVFGHKNTLSVRGTPDAIPINLRDLGQARLNALFDPAIGPYSSQQLERQYFIWPRSIAETCGPTFLIDLKNTVNKLYPGEVPYNPLLITYDDSKSKGLGQQGRAILEAIDNLHAEPGYGIVMLSEQKYGKYGKEDQLASMVMRELRSRDLFVSIIHTDMANKAYFLPQNAQVGKGYTRTDIPKVRGKLEGYLRNVAITKVLLTNERWPFILGTPLCCQLTIGIDVKSHTACLSFIGSMGSDIRTVIKESSQKEQLSKEQLKTIILNTCREEASAGKMDIVSVVIHRDGRLFEDEIAGIESAFRTLQNEGIIKKDANLNFLEISKSSPAPVRLFDVIHQKNQTETNNPEIGSYWIPSSGDAYLCSTGRSFPRRGTVNPLHIRYIKGTMPFVDLLQDVYFLTGLAWTRPEDCTRYPLTIKLADIRLREHAGDYDSDAIEYGDPDEELNNE